MAFVNPNLVYTDFTTGISTYADGTVVETPYPNKWEGYEYKNGHNYYLGEDVSRGGYVYSNPGMYGSAITLDIISEHPHSIIALQLFGEKTKLYSDIVEARVEVKHHEYSRAEQLFDGKLKPYLKDESGAKAVAGGLKTPINSVYGLTSAPFGNVFKDPRNKNNIVALRGALFMCMLRHEVEDRGYTVIHIKTDSIKIANPDDDIINYCYKRAKEYGYAFDVEAKWDRICLIDKAQFIGHQPSDSPQAPNEWVAVGAKFQQPFIFKKLFSKEKIDSRDLTITKSVKAPAAIYIHRDEKEDIFVGRIGSFMPVTEASGIGGTLLRVDKKADKKGSLSGTKGWIFAETQEVMNKKEPMSVVNMEYFDSILSDAKKSLAKYGDVDTFLSVGKEPTNDIPF